MFKETTVYIVGHGKTSNENAITSNFKIFFIGFVVDTATDEIVDMESSVTIGITSEFIKSLFGGKTFDKYRPEIEEEVNRRYFGTSQKAIITAYKDALKKYLYVKEQYYK